MYAMKKITKESADADDAAEPGMSLLWGLATKASRGPQPAHTRDGIADAAVRIADEEGLDAVSMRRVAAEIGTRATSLYRYVRAKDELLDLMVDQVMGEFDAPSRSGEWRSDLSAMARHMRALMMRHPWMISIPAPLGPNSLVKMEATLSALDGHGLDNDALNVILTTLSTFTRGYAAREISVLQAQSRARLSLAQWQASQHAYIEMIRSSGRFPLFSGLLGGADATRQPKSADQEFDESLECLLDGIAQRMSR